MSRVDPNLAAQALIGARREGLWYRADCPYCIDATGKADRRQSLGIKPSIEFFMCHKCGARGRLPSVPDTTWSAERDLAALASERLPDLGQPESFEPIWTDEAWTSITMSEPVNYLRGRGLSRETMRGAQVGACMDGYFAGRVVIPCLDLDEETWLGFVARDYTGLSDMRYRYPRGMPRGRFLYNQLALYQETDDPVIIVEGVFDALPYWPDAVACLGKPSGSHRALMTEARRPIAVCLDGDAHEEAYGLSEWLRLEGKVSGHVRLPPRTDPCTVDRVWLREEAKRCTRQ